MSTKIPAPDPPFELKAEGEFTAEHLAVLAELFVDLAEQQSQVAQANVPMKSASASSRTTGNSPRQRWWGVFMRA